MAGGSVLSGVVPAESSCKSCKKVCRTGLLCAKCGAIFHPSCGTRAKRCCGLKLQESDVSDDESDGTDCDGTGDEESSSALLKCFKLLVTELRASNRLLIEKISRLEGDNDVKDTKLSEAKSEIIRLRKILAERLISYEKSGKNGVDPIDPGNKNVRSQMSIQPSGNDMNHRNPQSTDGVVVEGGSNHRGERLPHGSSVSLKQPKAQRYASVAAANTGSVGNSDAGNVDGTEMVDGDGFQEVRYRKTRPRSEAAKVNLKYGTGEQAQGFCGAERRIWIYVGRVKPQVTADDIINYLKLKCPGEDFTCEQLQSKGPNSSFKVGANFSMKETMMNDAFWPVGVIFRRFGFSGGSKFKETAANFRSPTSQAEPV